MDTKSNNGQSSYSFHIPNQHLIFLDLKLPNCYRQDQKNKKEQAEVHAESWTKLLNIQQEYWKNQKQSRTTINIL